MSSRIGVGDAVLVQVNDKIQAQRIGLIKYIGYIDDHKKRKYIGINLVEKIENGNDGSINGVQYFQCIHGHGVYVGIKNIIKKLIASELTTNMQNIITILTQRLDEYVAALSQRDDYIEILKDTARRLRKQINAFRNHNSADSIPLGTIKELASTPPPMNKSGIDVNVNCTDSQVTGTKKRFSKLKTKKPFDLDFDHIEKHSEYTKYKASPKNVSSSEEWTNDDDDSEGDTYYDDTVDTEVEFDEVDYHSLRHFSMEKTKKPTPISISISLKSKQKSHSSHNTPISIRSYHTDNQNNTKAHSSHNTPISHSSSPLYIARNAYDQNMQKMYDIMSLSPPQHVQQMQMQNIQSFQNIPNMLQNTPHLPFKTLSLNRSYHQQHHHPQRRDLTLEPKRSNSLSYGDMDGIPQLKQRGRPLRMQRSLPQQLLHLPINAYDDASATRTHSMPSHQMQAYF